VTAKTEPKSVTLYHPTLAGVTREVPAAAVESWSEQGWLKNKPKNPR
jgi:hypothetical protein